MSLYRAGPRKLHAWNKYWFITRISPSMPPIACWSIFANNGLGLSTRTVYASCVVCLNTEPPLRLLERMLPLPMARGEQTERDRPAVAPHAFAGQCLPVPFLGDGTGHPG